MLTVFFLLFFSTVWCGCAAGGDGDRAGQHADGRGPAHGHLAGQSELGRRFQLSCCRYELLPCAWSHCCVICVQLTVLANSFLISADAQVSPFVRASGIGFATKPPIVCRLSACADSQRLHLYLRGQAQRARYPLRSLQLQVIAFVILRVLLARRANLLELPIPELLGQRRQPRRLPRYSVVSAATHSSRAAASSCLGVWHWHWLVCSFVVGGGVRCARARVPCIAAVLATTPAVLATTPASSAY